MNVVLSEDEQPLFVGYSQHCLGQQRAWSDTTRVDETHPIVHVALGSHANYFEPGLHEFDPSCVPLQVQALLARLGLPFPADVVSANGVGVDRVVPVLHIDDEHPAWVSFPGFWGELQFFHAPGVTQALGTSPVGPAFHAVWTDPLATLAAWD